MKTPPYYENMANGRLCIVLENGIDYGRFYGVAIRWASRLGLQIEDRGDGVDCRIWTCKREGCDFWLSFDDWFPHICLEPKDECAAAMICSIGVEIGISQPAEQDGPTLEVT